MPASPEDPVEKDNATFNWILETQDVHGPFAVTGESQLRPLVDQFGHTVVNPNQIYPSTNPSFYNLGNQGWSDQTIPNDSYTTEISNPAIYKHVSKHNLPVNISRGAKAS
jgi:hypothetical protein